MNKIIFLYLNSISHVRGRVFVSLANEKIIIFHRNQGKKFFIRLSIKISSMDSLDGTWNLNNFHLILTGKSRESVRCAIHVSESIWFGIANRVYVLDIQTLEIRVN